MYREGNTWADPVPQDSTAHSWRKWFDFELYGIIHVPGSWYNEINTARPQMPLTAVQRPMPSQIRGYKKKPGEKDVPAPPSDSRRPNTPRDAPSTAADFPTILTEYIARWDSLAPHEELFPLPSVDFRIQSLQDRQQFGELTRLVNNWDDDTVMKANAFQFFAKGFGLDMTVKVVSGKTHLRLVEGQAEDSELQTLLKHLKRKEYFRWHPDKINLRAGHPGILNEQIGKQDAVVAVRSAIQELIEECERLLG